MFTGGLFLKLFVLSFAVAARSQNVVLTNDDGWATANIRAQYDSLTAGGFNVVLSAPAENQSGTGSLSKTPVPLTEPCEFDTCPAGSPAEGFNVSDPHLNYVNAFPVDAARYGIQTLAPEFFDGSGPDFVVSGPNVGSNLGIIAIFSGTVGAACEAAQEGFPSAAFSGMNGSQVSYTTLDSDPDASSTTAARIYAALTTHLVQIITSSGPAPLLPDNVTLNVNFASIDDCPDASSYQWVLSRLIENPFASDVTTCGSSHLPSESSVISTGCFASVTVISATTKLDVSAAVQQAVMERLSGLPFSCLPS
ncbi:sure-like protein [Obba rivulosa]|uniref:Sure-like protein n=1 Tax=Obba rivulosa TaxID=1052685 RepID=A0A8E2DJ46_9APHY|nr:sure-like protein [Obba rivulosa]